MNAATAQELGRVLVTGATGALGQRLVRRLLAQGLQVAILSRDPARARALWPRASGLEIRQGNLSDANSLRGVGAGIDTLLHLASYSPPPGTPDLYNAPAHWQVSAEGTERLMRALASSPLRNMVYVSSVKVMGRQRGRRSAPQDERTLPAPECLYGRAKLAAEQTLLASGRACGAHATVLRLPLVYGLGEAGNLPRLVAAIAARRFPPWPRIDNDRSAVHAEDAITAILWAAGTAGLADGCWFVTDGKGYSTRWIYERTLHALKRPVPRWTVPHWLLSTGARLGTLAERQLGWHLPLTDEALEKLVEDAWYASPRLNEKIGFRPRYQLGDEITRLANSLRI